MMSEKKPASTELPGGAGFTYEDNVVAYYLAGLLERQRAAGQAGVVTSVAVQQRGHGNPMDDLVVEFDELGTRRVLGLQIKRSLTVGSGDKDFCAIVAAAVKTQALSSFTRGTDKCGFIVEHVTDTTLRTLPRLIEWAGDSPTGAEFEVRFAPTGTAAKAEIDLRATMKTLVRAAATIPRTGSAAKEISETSQRLFFSPRCIAASAGQVARVLERLVDAVLPNKARLFDDAERHCVDGGTDRRAGDCGRHLGVATIQKCCDGRMIARADIVRMPGTMA
jgi:hypothetical protein